MTPSSIGLFTIFLLGIFVAITDSNVSIEVHGLSDTNGRYLCNTSVVLTCEITGYMVSMEWKIDDERKSNCFFDACNSYPPFPGNYNFTNDIVDNGTSKFNITIYPLTLSDRGKSFVCSAEAVSATVTLQVTGENEDFNISCTDNQSLPYIDALTGCFDSNTTVEFIWTKTKVGSTNATSIYKREDGIVLPCTSVCIDSGRIQRKSMLSFKEDADGDKYTFQVEVKYENVSHTKIVYNFGREFKLKDGGILCSIKCDIVCKLLIVIGVVFAIAVIIGCSLLYVMLISYPTKEDYSKEDKLFMLCIEILLHTVSAILWIVIVILFIWTLHQCCICADPYCNCCEIVMILRYVLVTLFGIHVLLWSILLYVLYKMKEKEDGKYDIHFKTKLTRVRFVFTTIPMVGLFPVCSLLIRIYRYGNRTIHDKQMTSEKKTRKLPSIPKRILTINRTEDKRNKSQKKAKKEQDNIDQSFKQTINSSEDRDEQMKEDQLSASEITIVKAKGTDIKSNANIQKIPDARSAFTHSVTQQLSPNNRDLQTRSPDHNEKHEKNMSDNQNHGPNSDENPQRKIDVTNKQSGSKKKSDSKAEVKPPKKRKSRKETDENKSTKTTDFVITDAHTGNTQVMKIGSYDPPDSGDGASPLNISHNTVRNRKKSRKNKKEKEGTNNTKPLSAESHNGSETMKRALSANFDDKYDATTTVSIDSD